MQIHAAVLQDEGDDPHMAPRPGIAQGAVKKHRRGVEQGDEHGHVRREKSGRDLAGSNPETEAEHECAQTDPEGHREHGEQSQVGHMPQRHPTHHHDGPQSEDGRQAKVTPQRGHRPQLGGKNPNPAPDESRGGTDVRLAARRDLDHVSQRRHRYAGDERHQNGEPPHAGRSAWPQGTAHGAGDHTSDIATLGG